MPDSDTTTQLSQLLVSIVAGQQTMQASLAAIQASLALARPPQPPLPHLPPPPPSQPLPPQASPPQLQLLPLPPASQPQQPQQPSPPPLPLPVAHAPPIHNAPQAVASAVPSAGAASHPPPGVGQPPAPPSLAQHAVVGSPAPQNVMSAASVPSPQHAPVAAGFVPPASWPAPPTAPWLPPPPVVHPVAFSFPPAPPPPSHLSAYGIQQPASMPSLLLNASAQGLARVSPHTHMQQIGYGHHGPGVVNSITAPQSLVDQTLAATPFSCLPQSLRPQGADEVKNIRTVAQLRAALDLWIREQPWDDQELMAAAFRYAQQTVEFAHQVPIERVKEYHRAAIAAAAATQAAVRYAGRRRAVQSRLGRVHSTSPQARPRHPLVVAQVGHPVAAAAAARSRQSQTVPQHRGGRRVSHRWSRRSYQRGVQYAEKGQGQVRISSRCAIFRLCPCSSDDRWHMTRRARHR